MRTLGVMLNCWCRIPIRVSPAILSPPSLARRARVTPAHRPAQPSAQAASLTRAPRVHAPNGIRAAHGRNTRGRVPPRPSHIPPQPPPVWGGECSAARRSRRAPLAQKAPHRATRLLQQMRRTAPRRVLCGRTHAPILPRGRRRSDARLRCTAQMHGSDARLRCTAQMHGSDARLRCTAQMQTLIDGKQICKPALGGAKAALNW